VEDFAGDYILSCLVRDSSRALWEFSFPEHRERYRLCATVEPIENDEILVRVSFDGLHYGPSWSIRREAGSLNNVKLQREADKDQDGLSKAAWPETILLSGLTIALPIGKSPSRRCPPP